MTRRGFVQGMLSAIAFPTAFVEVLLRSCKEKKYQHLIAAMEAAQEDIFQNTARASGNWISAPYILLYTTPLREFLTLTK